MRVLALDTTSRAGSVALLEDDCVLAEHEGDASRPYAERLPADLVNLLALAGVPMTAVDLFAVAAGPGSFTSLRIGIATMQGLAFVTHRPIVAVSALETLAQMAAVDLAPGALVGAWLDAFRHDVFSALYRVGDAPPYSPERLIELDAAAVADPPATLSRWHVHGPLTAIVGDGTVAAHRQLLAGSTRVVGCRPLAAAMGRMALARERGGLALEPAAVHPLYIRRPDAEVERERRAAADGNGDNAAITRGPAGGQ